MLSNECNKDTIKRLNHELVLNLQAGDVPGAIRTARALVDASPSSTFGWMSLAELWASDGDLEGAVDFARRAAAVNYNDPEPAIRCIEWLLALGERGAAQEAGRGLVRSLMLPEQADRIGALLTHGGAPDIAKPFFQRAVAARPDIPEFRFNLASAQHMLGEMGEAERNLDAVLAIDPNDGSAQLARSMLRRQTPSSNHVEEIRRCIKQSRQGSSRIAAHYALAKELEDLGDHGDSFLSLKKGSDAVRKSLRYDVREDLAVIDRLRPGNPNSHVLSSQGAEAIFIVGLPRSGTTLIDRIIGMQPGVRSLGETNAFASQAIRAATRSNNGRPLGKQDFTEAMSKVDVGALGKSYLDVTRQLSGNANCFIDKTPTNYLYVDLIMRALPSARLILVKRDPLDVCYAMYKTLFANTYPFSYNLDDLGRYHVSWEKLMERWKDAFGDRLLEVKYEDVVTDVDAQGAKILNYCGLSSVNAPHKFFRNQFAVTTASAAQVREPIHSRSVGLWKLYQSELSPLLKALSCARPSSAQ